MRPTLIYQIDKVLEFFSHHEIKLHNGTKVLVPNTDRFSARNLIRQAYPELDFAQFHNDYYSFIDELIEKGYLKAQPEDITVNPIIRENINITFKGRLLMEQRGYQGAMDQKKILEVLEASARANRRWMLLLTILVALGTMIAAVYYGIEVWKFFYSSCR